MRSLKKSVNRIPAPSRNRVQKVFRFDPEVLDWLREMSERTGFTMTEIMETCIRAVGRDAEWLLRDFYSVSPDSKAADAAVRGFKKRRVMAENQ